MTTQTSDSKPRALIAMSGGVDSSVAAWLMQQAGYDCTGITMRLTRNETLGQSGFHTCCSEKDIEDAAEVAYAMDIPYEVLDFTADFREQIIEKFVRVYEAGGTPNPCIDCNKYMKFRHLLDWARAHGMEYVVTGHYARVEQDEATGRFLLKKGLDEGKDQSYVLYNLTQEQLAHIRLPLGGLHKTEVREIAEQHKFVNARKHDSQDICFVPDGDYARFMEDFTGKHYPAGDFLDESGKVVGTHNGAVRYTIGQRKGLGISAETRLFVSGKNMAENTVTVGLESALFHSSLLADEWNWIAAPPAVGQPLPCTARTRYHQPERPAGSMPRKPAGRSIEERPEHINNRSTFGHWEMDSVESCQGVSNTYIVMTERKTRWELIIPSPDKTAASVVAAIDGLEAKYGDLFPKVFRSITCDNGCEFADAAGIERSASGKGARTEVYYCHPYRPSERGSNENQNGLIRRHVPKGTDLSTISDEETKRIEAWLNNYPRKMFGYLCSEQLFREEMALILAS